MTIFFAFTLTKQVLLIFLFSTIIYIYLFIYFILFYFLLLLLFFLNMVVIPPLRPPLLALSVGSGPGRAEPIHNSAN